MSPGDPDAFVAMTAIAHAHMALGNYEEALKAAERSLAVNPNYDPTYWMLISGERAARPDGRGAALAGEVPGACAGRHHRQHQRGQPDKDPTRLAAILEGLRLAGLDEG